MNVDHNTVLVACPRTVQQELATRCSSVHTAIFLVLAACCRAACLLVATSTTTINTKAHAFSLRPLVSVVITYSTNYTVIERDDPQVLRPNRLGEP